MECKNEIIGIISGLSALPESEIAMEDKFADIGIDSLKIVELIIKIEGEMNIQIDDGELDPGKLTTVKSMVELAEKYTDTGE